MQLLKGNNNIYAQQEMQENLRICRNNSQGKTTRRIRFCFGL